MKRALVLGALLFAGCVTCTLMEVWSNLVFVLPSAEASELTAAPSTIQTCLKGACWSVELDQTDGGHDFDARSRTLTIRRAAVISGEAPWALTVPTEQHVDVSLTVSRDGGTVFTHAWSDVKFQKTEPNGAGCGVLYQLESPLTF